MTRSIGAALRERLGGVIGQKALSLAQLSQLSELSPAEARHPQRILLQPERLAKAARKLGAPFVLRVELSRRGWLYEAHAILIDAKSGEQRMDFTSGYYKPRQEAADRGKRIARVTINKIETLLSELPPVAVKTEQTEVEEPPPPPPPPELIDEVPTEGGSEFAVDTLLDELGLEAEDETSITVFLGGYVYEEARLDVQLQSEENGEAYFEAWSRIFAFVEPKIGLTTKLRLSADVDIFLQVRDEAFAPLSDVALEEAYLAHAFDFVQFKLGRQIINWGVLDVASPQNQINPRDLRFSIINADEDGLDYVPVLAARALFPIGRFTFDAAVIPIVPIRRGAVFGTDFADLRPNLLNDALDGFRDRVVREVQPAYQPTYLGLADTLGDFVDVINPRTGADSDTLQLFSTPPPFNPKNFEAGARLTGSIDNFDLGVSFQALHYRTPRVTISPRLREIIFDLPPISTNELQSITANLPNQIQGDFPRFYLFGGNLGLRLGEVILKAETAYKTNQNFYNSSLDPISADRIDTGLHLEYIRGTAIQVVVEAIHSHVFSDQVDNLLLFTQDNVTLFLGISFSTLRDRLKLELNGAYEIAYRDFYVAPQIAYKFTDELALFAGAQIFWGPPADLSYDIIRDPTKLSEVDEGVFSYYRDNSFAYMRLKYGF